MSNTTVEGERVIIITGLDADWHSSVEAKHARMKVVRWQFNPSAADDQVIVRNKHIDGEVLFDSALAIGTSGIEKTEPKGRWCEPVIDITDCTFTTAASAKVIIEYA